MKYTVLPKNPACQAQIVEADGYEWGAEKWISKRRLVFWKLPQGITQLTGEPPRKISRLASDTDMPIVVAEFAVDWVAGVQSEQES